jgi:hypothetical protein
VFTKLFDSLYGKFDVGFIIGTSLLVFLFAGFFIVFLWSADRHGTLAGMMGVRDDEEKKGRTRLLSE